MMREMLQTGEAERPGSALDRMHRSKDRVDRFVIMLGRLQCKQTGFRLDQAFITFLEEDILDFLELHSVSPLPDTAAAPKITRAMPASLMAASRAVPLLIASATPECWLVLTA